MWMKKDSLLSRIFLNPLIFFSMIKVIRSLITSSVFSFSKDRDSRAIITKVKNLKFI